MKATRICTIEGCERTHQARGLCGTHYMRRIRGVPMDAARATIAERFWAKVDAAGPCWVWIAAKDGDGYGSFWSTGGARIAHRVAYELLVGSIPDGLTLDHLCRNRACVNPDHLEPVTQAENTRRASARTVCHRGHELTDETTTKRVRADGTAYRACSECKRLSDAAAYERRRAR